ncbi:WW/Rsp5/WWP [Neofusicoccum parvum]|uniref:WW/Rsp5/WWP n=1 Tax=Neofusicoccum parvum TaxID=310453 RepID=A0ACB5SHA4_9PEZI|nr:WW/Rsp5/WWP [Neofusicoccum parvum]
MADFAPPPGPPPPKIPAGWKAQWNEQYHEWFYVNIYTKQSQWEKPTEPIYPPSDAELGAPPAGPPPSYAHGDAKPVGAEKTGLSSNNPFGPGGGSSHDISEDERLARQLQAEEDARAHGGAGDRGASDSYYQQGGGAPGYQAPGYQQQQGGYGSPVPGYGGSSSSDLPPRPEDKGKKSGGFLGKLLGKASGSKPGGGGGMMGGFGGHHQQQQQYGYPQQQQGGYYGGPPQGQYGYAPQQGYYGQGGGGGGMPHQDNPGRNEKGLRTTVTLSKSDTLSRHCGLVGSVLQEDVEFV